MPPSIVSVPDVTAATIAQTGTQAGSAAAQTAATTAQTAQQAAAAAAALGQKSTQDTWFNIENALQTAEMVARNVQMLNEWNESRKDRDSWKSRNDAEFATKAAEYDRQTRQALTEKGLASADTNIDRRETDLQDKEFDIAGSRAYTGRRATAATDQAEEEAAGLSGAAVDDYQDYLFGLGARAGDYEKEAKDFTDPLLAAAPGSTVSGSRYLSEFDDMAKAASYSRDNRQAEVEAFRQALGDSTNYLSGIDVAQSGLQGQTDKINKEVQLEGLDQALAAAGLQNKGVALGEDRSNLDDKKAEARYQDIFGKLGTQRSLDNIAKSHGRTLTGQQNITFPAGQLLGNINKSYKTKNTGNAGTGYNFPTYGSKGQNTPYGGTFNPSSRGGGF